MKRLLATGVLSVAVLTMLTGCISISVNDNGKKANVNIGKKVSATLSTKKFNNLTINTSDTDVVFKKGDKYQVKYSGGKKIMPTIKQNGNDLVIKEKSSISISINSQAPKITVTIPETQLNKISVSTADGDILGEKISAKTVNLKSGDGDIKLTDLSADNGEIHLTDGDATIDNLKTTGGCHISSTDGDVTVRQTNASGFAIDTTDGDIHIGNTEADSSYSKNTDSKNVLYVSTVDGDVEIN